LDGAAHPGEQESDQAGEGQIAVRGEISALAASRMKKSVTLIQLAAAFEAAKMLGMACS
jgi:hypothetical protein